MMQQAGLRSIGNPTKRGERKLDNTISRLSKGVQASEQKRRKKKAVEMAMTKDRSLIAPAEVNSLKQVMREIVTYHGVRTISENLVSRLSLDLV